MNVLYICHRFPFPPKRGGKIRPFNMIRHFHQQGHKVWVASLVRTKEEMSETAGIEEYCHQHYMAMIDSKVQMARMIARLLSSVPSTMGYFYSRKLKGYIDQLLKNEKFDLIFVHCSSVAQYVSEVKHIPKILDFGDMDSQKWLSYKDFKPFPMSMGYWLEGFKLEAEEKRLAGKFDLCTATTKLEWQTLESYGTALKTGWFPNGVDSNVFKPDETSYKRNAISFIGRMDYYPNQECMQRFCELTLPLIKQKVPDVELYIIGAEPNKQIKALARIPGVVVTGTVDDVKPYVRKTVAMVAPLNIARGTQNKILEAMAMGVPVVSSKIAAGGIDAEPGEHFLTAETPQEYADCLVEFLQNSSLREKFSQNGRSRVQSNHDWESSMRRLDALIDNCLMNI